MLVSDGGHDLVDLVDYDGCIEVEYDERDEWMPVKQEEQL